MLYLLNNGSAIKKYDGAVPGFPLTSAYDTLYVFIVSHLDHVRG